MVITRVLEDRQEVKPASREREVPASPPTILTVPNLPGAVVTQLRTVTLATTTCTLFPPFANPGDNDSHLPELREAVQSLPQL